MEALLYIILQFGFYVGLSYLAGFLMRLSSEAKLIIGVIVCIFIYGIGLSEFVFGQSVDIPSGLTNFILVAFIMLPIGYMSANPIIQSFNSRAERVFGSDEFDETYRKYAQKQYNQDKRDNADYFDAEAFRKQYHRHYHSGNYGANEQTYRQKKSFASTAQPEKYKYFKALDILDQDATADEIKSAYRKLARKYHPDVLASKGLGDAELDEAMKRMQEINAAHDWLKEEGYV